MFWVFVELRGLLLTSSRTNRSGPRDLKPTLTVVFFLRCGTARSLESGDHCIAAWMMPIVLLDCKRSWDVIQSLTAILSVLWDYYSKLCRSGLDRVGLNWKEVAGDLRQKQPAGCCLDFEEGCRLLNKQCTSVPDLLS